MALVVGLLVALGLVGLGAYLSTQDLNRAAAWANIIALFVAGASLVVGLIGVLYSPSALPTEIDKSGSQPLAAKIKQSGISEGDVINVVGSGNSISTGKVRRR